MCVTQLLPATRRIIPEPRVEVNHGLTLFTEPTQTDRDAIARKSTRRRAVRRIGKQLFLAGVVAAVCLSAASPKAQERPESPGAAVSDTAKAAAAEIAPSGISGNLAAVNIVTGTGLLGRMLGIDPDSGVRIGGAWVANANFLVEGGEKACSRATTACWWRTCTSISPSSRTFAALSSAPSSCNSTVSRQTTKRAR